MYDLRMIRFNLHFSPIYDGSSLNTIGTIIGNILILVSRFLLHSVRDLITKFCHKTRTLYLSLALALKMWCLTHANRAYAWAQIRERGGEALRVFSPCASVCPPLAHIVMEHTSRRTRVHFALNREACVHRVHRAWVKFPNCI